MVLFLQKSTEGGQDAHGGRVLRIQAHQSQTEAAGGPHQQAGCGQDNLRLPEVLVSRQDVATVI